MTQEAWGVLQCYGRYVGLKRTEWTLFYLGYWIKECQKMAYKAEYEPLQVFEDLIWQTAQTQGALKRSFARFL